MSVPAGERKEIRQMVRRIASQFQPEKIILFGSHARGDAGPDSDVDPKRGAVVPIPPGKARITIRLDEDLLQWFKDQVHAAGGGNYQTLINAALRDYVDETKRHRIL